MPNHPGGRWLPWLISVVMVAPLVVPLPHSDDSPLWRMVSGTSHVILFTVLAWQLAQCAPARLRGLKLWFGLAILAGLIEMWQLKIGRSAEWSDWFYGLLGATGAIGTAKLHSKLRVAVLLGLALIPPLWIGTLLAQEARAFPVLLDPQSIWARQGWTQQGGQVQPLDFSKFCFRANSSGEEVEYPGLFRPVFHCDWRGITALRGSIYWPNAMPTICAIRVDDQRGNPPYADRFQREMAITQGWNQIVIPSAELRMTPSGRELQMEQIQQWGIFLIAPPQFENFVLGCFALELGGGLNEEISL